MLALSLSEIFQKRSFCHSEVGDGSSGMDAICNHSEVADGVIASTDEDTFRVVRLCELWFAAFSSFRENRNQSFM